MFLSVKCNSLFEISRQIYLFAIPFHFFFFVCYYYHSSFLNLDVGITFLVLINLKPNLHSRIKNNFVTLARVVWHCFFHHVLL